MNKQAFTLVELIVVITILAILATIGFVSFSGYLAGARDTNRIAQLKAMSDSLELYRTKKDLPIPDDKVDIQSSGTTIAYQGYIGANVLETIEYTEKGLDPKDKTYFSYYLTKNKKYFQLLSFLEEANTDVVANIGHPQGVFLQNNNVGLPFMGNLYAVDYTNRFPKVTGKKLGILTDDSNTPIQEVTTIIASGYLDLNDVGVSVYKSIISDEEVVSGSGVDLSSTNPNGNCKRIKQLKGSSEDGFYTIDPAGDGVGFEVYCDMTINGGGWTRYSEMNADGYYLKQLGKKYLSGVTEMFYSYKRRHTGDDWFAYKFTQLYFNKCGVVKGDLDNVKVGVNDYIDHMENDSWGDCVYGGGPMNIKIEKIIDGAYKDDVCINGTLNAVGNSRWDSKVTTDGRTVGSLGHYISNTTVLMGTDGWASGRCAGVSDSLKSNSETYIYVR